MIALSLGGMLVAYAGGLVVALLFVWIAGNILRHATSRHRRRHCIHCVFCGSIYENSTKDSLPACPQCARANERVPPPFV